jgi:Amt family ammonium transporter
VLIPGSVFDGNYTPKWVNFGWSSTKSWLQHISSVSVVGQVPEYLFFMFQLTFAAITPALVIGGFTERMKFSAVF